MPFKAVQQMHDEQRGAVDEFVREHVSWACLFDIFFFFFPNAAVQIAFFVYVRCGSAP